jgi:hypothetical protein
MQVIIFSNDSGGVSVCFPADQSNIEEVKNKDTPSGSIIVSLDSLPTFGDGFMDSWEIQGTSVIINLEKAKNIAHTIRRSRREDEFKPFDEIIAKQIPGLSFQEAETARQAVRDKYAVIQEQIDGSTSLNEIKIALNL